MTRLAKTLLTSKLKIIKPVTTLLVRYITPKRTAKLMKNQHNKHPLQRLFLTEYQCVKVSELYCQTLII